MKTMLLLISSLLTFACAAFAADTCVNPPSTYKIGDPIPEKRVAVMDLKVFGEYSEQVQDWLPALIEERLLKEGWTLVVRGQRMQHVQDEHNLPGIKPETRLPENELLGATTLIELTARVQTKAIRTAVGYKVFGLDSVVRASVDLNGQVVDPATGVLKSSVSVGGSATGLKTALIITIGSDWRIGAAGYDVDDIRSTLVGKAADTAAGKMIDRLKALYPSMPGQLQPAQPGLMQPAGMQLSSTTIKAEIEPTILIDLPDPALVKVGDRFGVYRGEKLISEIEIKSLAGKRAVARIISQTDAIKSTDVARKMAVVIKAQ